MSLAGDKKNSKKSSLQATSDIIETPVDTETENEVVALANDDEDEYEEEQLDEEDDIQLEESEPIDEDAEDDLEEELEELDELEQEDEDGGEVEEEIDENDPFKPTTLVLAKVKGYPAWPAMVLKESLLPENIIRKKPKPSKSKKQTRSLPVRFFSDDTYIWIHEQDLKVLDNSMIQEYFNSSSKKRRKDNLLENAYQLAIDPPDMELFVRYGSKAVPPEEEELELLLQPIVEEPSKKTTPAKKKRRGRAPAVKISKKDEAKLKAKKLQEEKRKLEEKLLAEYDDDWGLEGIDGYDEKSGNYIFSTKAEQSILNINSAKLQQDLTKFQNRFQKVSDELRQLLDDDFNESTVTKALNDLEKLLNEKLFPKTIFSKSKLLRLLILIARKPLEQFEYKLIKLKILKILQNSLDLTIPMNTIEELQIEEPVEENGAGDIKQETEVNGTVKEGVEKAADAENQAAEGDADTGENAPDTEKDVEAKTETGNGNGHITAT